MLLNVLSVVIGILGTIALSGTISFADGKTAYGNSTTAFLLMVFAVLVLRYVYARVRLSDKKGIMISVAYSFLLGGCLTIGKQLELFENAPLGNPLLWIQMILLGVFFAGPVLFLFQWGAEKQDGKAKLPDAVEKASAGKVDWKYFFLTWVAIFICWIPVFLAFYPGAFVYDAQDEYVQVATRTFTTHHPLSHVLMLGGFVCLGNKLTGSYNVGIAMYTVVQMVILSGIFAYTVSYLRKYLAKGICAGIVLFYGLFPVVPMYAVCSSKDTLFNGAFLLMIIQLLKILEVIWSDGTTEKKKVHTADLILFVLASATAMLFRNNGLYAYGVLFVCTAIFAFYKRKAKPLFMRLAIMMLASLVLYMGIDKTLAFALDAEKGGKQEILTVPIQQLARTYQYSPEVFSQEDKEILFSYIPENSLALYDADLSDYVKVGFDNEQFAKEPAQFLGLWGRIFLKKPLTYLNAWFMTSYGYWYPDTIINVYGGQSRFTYQYEDSSYFGFETEHPGVRDSKFPWLEEQYRKMSLELYQQNVPGISMLFSPGGLFWIFALCMGLCLYRKRKVWLLPMTGIFLLWGTVIPGPTFLVRYVLILWFALPVILYAGFGKIVNKL